ncbi:MAG: hypothetical protein DMG38_18860 [Acidobacteria bacterium]|nr:MAG: hypothetical protein DMG38_18860 [Acidobacteriota bacterium]
MREQIRPSSIYRQVLIADCRAGLSKGQLGGSQEMNGMCAHTPPLASLLAGETVKNRDYLRSGGSVFALLTAT